MMARQLRAPAGAGFGLILALLLSLAISGVASAQGREAPAPGYEGLLEQLRDAKSQGEADILAGRIWEIWLTAPDETAQELLDGSIERRRAGDFLGAIQQLDRLVSSYPDYVEGWNQRATMFFLTGEFEKSLADVAEVLAREPRHFGALSGKAVILAQQGKIPLAQIAVREALRHHPFLRERALLDASPGTDL